MRRRRRVKRGNPFLYRQGLQAFLGPDSSGADAGLNFWDRRSGRTGVAGVVKGKRSGVPCGSPATVWRRLLDRTQKEQLVASLNDIFGRVNLVVVTKPIGLTVSESTDLRRQMGAAGASFKVTKNRLTRLALKGTAFEPLTGLFVGPTAIAFSEDPVAAARVAVTFAEKNTKLEILGGALYQEMLDIAAVNSLAKLPSLDELRARMIGMISTPATRVAGVLQAPAAQLARVMSAYASKDEAA